MSYQVEDYKGFSIRKYGGCGVFFFLVSRLDTRAIVKRTLPSVEAAKEFIDDFGKDKIS